MRLYNSSEQYRQLVVRYQANQNNIEASVLVLLVQYLTKNTALLVELQGRYHPESFKKLCTSLVSNSLTFEQFQKKILDRIRKKASDIGAREWGSTLASALENLRVLNDGDTEAFTRSFPDGFIFNLNQSAKLEGFMLLSRVMLKEHIEEVSSLIDACLIRASRASPEPRVIQDGDESRGNFIEGSDSKRARLSYSSSNRPTG